MFQIFNIGHRLEVVCDERVAGDIVSVAREFQVDAQLVGHVEFSQGRPLVIEAADELFEFDAQ
jgi:phosphoribosylformylglycinamidine cyclo-ligase